MKVGRIESEQRLSCPFRFPGRYEDAETGLYYNRHRHYDPLAAQYIPPDPIGLEGGDRPQGYVERPTIWPDPLGLMTRVGRWMSREEYNVVNATGRVQKGSGCATSVSTFGHNAFAMQAPKGSIYMEFEIPAGSLLPGDRSDWKKLIVRNANRSPRFFWKNREESYFRNSKI